MMCAVRKWQGIYIDKMKYKMLVFVKSLPLHVHEVTPRWPDQYMVRSSLLPPVPCRICPLERHVSFLKSKKHEFEDLLTFNIRVGFVF
jgi:hypothetical protein